MGFFSGLDPEAYDRQYSDRQLLGRMGNYFRPLRRPDDRRGVALAGQRPGWGCRPLSCHQRLACWTRCPPLRSLLLVSGAVLATGILTWGVNWRRRRLTARCIGDVVMPCAATPSAPPPKPRPVFLRRVPLAAAVVSRITSDTQEFGHMIVLVTTCHPDSDGHLPGRHADSYRVAADADRCWHMPLVVLLAVALFRAAARRTYARGQPRHGKRQRRHPRDGGGIAVAKNFRQRRTSTASSTRPTRALHRQHAPRLCAGYRLSRAEYPGGLRQWPCSCTLAGSMRRPALISAGSWYLFMLSLDRFLFPVLQLASLLEPGAGRPVGRRARLCADRRRNRGGADAPAAGAAAARPDRVREARLPLFQAETVLEDFSLHIRPARTWRWWATPAPAKARWPS